MEEIPADINMQQGFYSSVSGFYEASCLSNETKWRVNERGGGQPCSSFSRSCQFCTLGCSPEGSHSIPFQHLKSALALRSSFGLYPDIAKGFL